jgi:hypothetical protein
MFPAKKNKLRNHWMKDCMWSGGHCEVIITPKHGNVLENTKQGQRSIFILVLLKINHFFGFRAESSRKVHKSRDVLVL